MMSWCALLCLLAVSVVAGPTPTQLVYPEEGPNGVNQIVSGREANAGEIPYQLSLRKVTNIDTASPEVPRAVSDGNALEGEGSGEGEGPGEGVSEEESEESSEEESEESSEEESEESSEEKREAKSKGGKGGEEREIPYQLSLRKVTNIDTASPDVPRTVSDDNVLEGEGSGEGEGPGEGKSEEESEESSEEGSEESSEEKREGKSKRGKGGEEMDIEKIEELIPVHIIRTV